MFTVNVYKTPRLFIFLHSDIILNDENIWQSNNSKQHQTKASLPNIAKLMPQSLEISTSRKKRWKYYSSLTTSLHLHYIILVQNTTFLTNLLVTTDSPK